MPLRARKIYIKGTVISTVFAIIVAGGCYFLEDSEDCMQINPVPVVSLFTKKQAKKVIDDLFACYEEKSYDDKEKRLLRMK